MRNFIPLISLPFFTSHLNPDDFGFLALALIYGVFIVGLLNLGLILVFERNYFEKDNSKDRLDLMWTCIIFILMNLLIGIFFTFQLEDFINKILFNGKLPPKLILLAVLSLSLKSILQYFYIYYRNEKKANYYSALSLFETFLILFFSVYFVIIQNGILGYIMGQVVGVFIILIALTFTAIYKNQIHFNFFMLKECLKLGFPLTPRIFFGSINTQFDRFILGVLNTTSGVGIYDIGQKIARAGFEFMTILQQVFSPEVFSTYIRDPKKFSIEIGVYITPFFYLSLLVCLLLGIFSQEIIYILTNPNYYEAFPIVIILSMLYGTYFFGKLPQLLLVKKAKLISFISLISTILNIVLNFPLIHLYGIMGAVWGTFISGMTSSLISFYYAQKYNPIYYPRFIYTTIVLFHIFLFTVILTWFYEINYYLSFFYRIILVIIFISHGISNNLLRNQLYLILKSK